MLDQLLLSLALNTTAVEGYQLENESAGETITVSEGAEAVIAEPSDDLTPVMVPMACYNDAVDCANRMKDQCLNRGGVKKVVFEATIEKCSGTCNNGDVINCTKVKYPQT